MLLGSSFEYTPVSGRSTGREDEKLQKGTELLDGVLLRKCTSLNSRELRGERSGAYLLPGANQIKGLSLSKFSQAISTKESKRLV